MIGDNTTNVNLEEEKKRERERHASELVHTAYARFGGFSRGVEAFQDGDGGIRVL